MKFVIVTGLSGSGKSEAMRALEDMGFYCVDNLPPALITKFAELCYILNSYLFIVCTIRHALPFLSTPSMVISSGAVLSGV